MFALIWFIGRAVGWVFVILCKIVYHLVKGVFSIAQLYGYNHRCPRCGRIMHTAMLQRERCPNCGHTAGQPIRQTSQTRRRSAGRVAHQPHSILHDSFVSANCHECRWSSATRNAERLGVRHMDSTGHLVIFN